MTRCSNCLAEFFHGSNNFISRNNPAILRKSSLWLLFYQLKPRLKHPTLTEFLGSRRAKLWYCRPGYVRSILLNFTYPQVQSIELSCDLPSKRRCVRLSLIHSFVHFLTQALDRVSILPNTENYAGVTSGMFDSSIWNLGWLKWSVHQNRTRYDRLEFKSWVVVELSVCYLVYRAFNYLQTLPYLSGPSYTRFRVPRLCWSTYNLTWGVHSTWVRFLKLNVYFQVSQLSTSSFGLLTFIQYNLALELHAFKSGMRTWAAFNIGPIYLTARYQWVLDLLLNLGAWYLIQVRLSFHFLFQN
jgi:hypothetical protein